MNKHLMGVLAIFLGSQFIVAENVYVPLTGGTTQLRRQLLDQRKDVLWEKIYKLITAAYTQRDPEERKQLFDQVNELVKPFGYTIFKDGVNLLDKVIPEPIVRSRKASYDRSFEFEQAIDALVKFNRLALDLNKTYRSYLAALHSDRDIKPVKNALERIYLNAVATRDSVERELADLHVSVPLEIPNAKVIDEILKLAK